MKTIEIITEKSSTTFAADTLKTVEIFTSDLHEGCSYVYFRTSPALFQSWRFDSNAVEKLYLSVKAFMHSDSDRELIIQLRGDEDSKMLVAVQTIQK